MCQLGRLKSTVKSSEREESEIGTTQHTHITVRWWLFHIFFADIVELELLIGKKRVGGLLIVDRGRSWIGDGYHFCGRLVG